MKVNEYQQLAMTTLAPHLDRKEVLINSVMGLCGESGEVIEIVKKIDESLNIHDFRMVKGVTHTNVLFDIAIPIKFKMTKSELRKYLENELKEINENYLLVLQIDQMYDRV